MNGQGNLNVDIGWIIKEKLAQEKKTLKESEDMLKNPEELGDRVRRLSEAITSKRTAPLA